MATISVRVDDELRDEFEDLASSQGVSVSELVRYAMEAHLGRDLPSNRSAGPTSLSKRARLQQSLLYRILSSVETDESSAEHYWRLAEVFERGYAGEYAEAFTAIEDELTLSDCRLVWDILDMFTVLKASVERLGTTAVASLDERASAALTFRGFDMNDRREGAMLGYARHLLASGRWEVLAEFFDDRHERGNSHMPTLDTYRRMLDVFLPVQHRMVSGDLRGRDRFDLTRPELTEIIHAWHHPDRRPRPE